MTYRRPRSNRKPAANRLLTVNDVYRQPVGPASDPKSLYALLLRFVRWRRERNGSETTLKTQTHHSYRFICWAHERGIHYAVEVTRPVLERWQRYLYHYRKPDGEPLSSRTQRTALQPLQVWFSWMAKQGLILANPAADLELPRLEKRLPRTILSVEQVEDILSRCDLSTLQGVRDRALLELLWSAGIRRGAAAGLEMYSADVSRKVLTLVQGKGKCDRVIPVGSRALMWLDHYLQHVRPDILVRPECRALFLAMDGVAGLTPNGITGAVVPYLRAAGIEKGSCHLFRHAMATQMLENGADLRWIQAMLGHRSVESTQIYTHVSISALQAVHAGTHPAEQREEAKPDRPENIIHNDTTYDTTSGAGNEHIHFRIDDETKRLAMQAAERQKISLTELMRQRAEELAAEERQYQDGKHDVWLEQQITQAFSRYDAGESQCISNDEMNGHMAELKAQAARGKL